MAELSRTNPYPGSRPFERGEKLFGRDREITELFYLLSGERIVVLHSPSGAGKTSLVNAGLVEKLEEGERFDVWPTIRLSSAPRGAEPAAGDGNRFVRSAVLSLEAGLPVRRRRPVEEIAGPTRTLAGYIEQRPRRPGAPSSVVLVFDQFEEILTLDVLGVADRKDFFRDLGEALKAPDVWALFVLREEYLALLDPYRDDVPTRFNNTFRINLLTIEGAVDAIGRPAHEAGREFAPDAAFTLAQDLATVSVQEPDGSSARVTGGYVEPLPLQVVCHRLWDKLPAATRTIGEEDVERLGDVDAALAAYYDGCIDEIARRDGIADPDVTIVRQLREWFSERLITRGGIRDQVLREKDRSGGLDNGLIGRLRDVHLVRSEQRAGATWYELAHDRLVAPVQTSNTAWFEQNLQPLQRQAKLWEQEDQPERLLLRGRDLKEADRWARNNSASVLPVERKLLATSLKRRRATRTRWGTLVLITALSFLLMSYALVKRSESISNEKRAISLLLASAAEDEVTRSPDVSLLLSLEAYRTSRTRQAARSMISALEATRRAGAQAVLRTHQGGVLATALSPDGRTLASAGRDGTVQLWDTGGPESTPAKLVRTLGGGRPVFGVAFSPDGRTLASAGGNGTVRLWDTSTPASTPVAPLRILEGGQGEIAGVAFSPDGRTLAAAGLDGTVPLWDTSTPASTPVAPLRILEGGQGRVYGVAFSPDGRTLASAGLTGSVLLWDTSRPANTPETPVRALAAGDPVYGVAFSRDGRTLAAGGLKGTVLLWDTSRPEDTPGTPFRVLRAGQRVNAVAFAPQGRDALAAAGNGGTVLLWDTSMPASTPRKPFRTLAGRQGNVRGLAFSPDGGALASAGSTGTVVLWDTSGPTGLGRSTNGHPGRFYGVAFDAQGDRLAAGGSDGSVALWDTTSPGGRAEQLQNDGSPVYGVGFDPEGDVLATADGNGELRLWSARTPHTLRSTWRAGQDVVQGIAFSPDGRTLASAGAEGASDLEGTVRLWDTSTPESPPANPSRTLPAGEHTVYGVAFSTKGHVLAAGLDDGTVLLWDTSRLGAPAETLETGQSLVYGVAFSPDGSMLATAGSEETVGASGETVGTVRLWDMRTRTVIVELGIPPRGTDQIDAYYGVAFSPDGRTLAATRYAGPVFVWDGILWPDLADLKTRVCRLVVGNLTRAEWGRHAPGLGYRTICPE